MCDIRDEFAALDLQDERLNRRGVLLLQRLGADPQASIPAACRGPTETDAAYKFFANDRVTAERLLKPHQEAMLERCNREEVVLLVQDTTELDYTQPRQQISGLGVLERPQRRGLYLHVHAAFTPEGCCLGVAGLDFLTRAPESLGKTRERSHLPIEQKESVRWLGGYHRACRMQQALPASRIVSIADCEADVYELFVAGESAGADPGRQAQWIVRAKQNRSLPERAPQEGAYGYQKLWTRLQRSPVEFQRTLSLIATPRRAAREATIAVHAQRLTLKPPHRSAGQLPPVAVHAVLAEEVNPPNQQEALDWLLITSLPIGAPQEIQRVIDYYRARWPIEPYFRTLKTGCKVEELRLETAERLKPCIAMYAIIAWRVMFVTMLGRQAPDLPADALFSEAEWKSVWRVVRREEPPDQPPPLKAFLPTLASLGGYLNRCHDPPPGPKALWIGLRRMADFAHAWRLFRTAPATTRS